jgi:Putative beta-barrel porin-2, OmpL-like. bbp2
MKIEKWKSGLAALGLAALAPALSAQTTNAPAPAPAPTAPALVPIQTALSATTISGYVDTSAVWNPGTGNANPAPYAFNAGKQDGFNVDAVDIKIAKAEDDTAWAAGYVAELSYGPDAHAIDGGAYPIRQAYVEFKVPVGNGIDFELGRWDNLLGYESSDSYKNPNFTRSYGYSFEPTEHTGLLATYKVNDSVQVQLGAADTLNTEGATINSRSDGSPIVESKKAVVSLLTLTAPTNWGAFSGSTLSAGFDHGQGTYGHDETEWYFGATLNTPVKGLTGGASFDLIDHMDLLTPATADSGYFYALAGYVSYAATDKLTLNARAEWADGEALSALALANNGGPSPLDKVIALTGTVQYNLWANVISRLEIRWDHSASGADAFGGIGPLGTVPPDKKNEVLIAANMIYKF